MADYKELLRRAVEALPENNGAARRAVYEKARAALVGQLRAINPPLPARDITSHRLQLEDCIRQVEQEASEANIAGLSSEPPSLPPVFAAEARKSAPAESKSGQKQIAGKVDVPRPAAKPELAKPPPIAAKGKGAANGSASIEDIIAAAERDRQPQDKAIVRAPEFKSRPPKSQPVLVARSEPQQDEDDEDERPQRPAAKKSENRQLPSIVARAEASKGRQAAPPSFGVSVDNNRRGPAI